MWSSRLFSSMLLLLLTLFSAQTIVRATEDEADEYDVKDRVVRISLISGEVNLKRKGNKDWERARLNFPLVEGDTLATDRDSRLEIQIDARNFVRLAAGTTIQIVALRDEGVALSVIEGTATVRLARFDRQHEYFEVDAPRSTMAAEKPGLYRIDVPSDGRVRFSVRDGGSARIYSDTSGFALRDGRTAELVLSGDNAGDWEFVANATSDAIDEWVNNRERYLAQRLRYNTQYYDEYIWGAEDLDAYGDWAYTSDYGWIWRPQATTINVYGDWAPYRYGHWVWCPPYGWTWVGYEPWGWAPYHYGRWVYYNGYWAWCPRSAFFHYHSWWRPALVVFVNVGDNYCWYPLRYHQRDPHSRYYSQPGRLTRLRSDELANLRRLNPVELRAVTTANARQIGSEGLRTRRADGALARRAMTEEPLRNGLPARPATSEAATGTSTATRPARMGSSPPVSTSTGASTRTPGVPLDDELRRSRVLNGRDARPATPVVNTTTPGNDIEARPTGAVTRPLREPHQPSDRVDGGLPSRSDERSERRSSVAPSDPSADVSRPSRVDPSSNPDMSEKPMRGRERIEPARPERQSESPAPTFEPRTQRSEPPARVEAPQRSEAPQQRSEPARSESPRSEPSRSESPRSEAPRSEPTRSEAPRSEPSRSESPRSEAPARPARPENYEPPERPSRSESPRSEPSRSESPRSETPKSEPRSEPSRSEPSRSEPSRSEPSRSEPSRSEPSRSSNPDTARPSKPDRPR